MMKGDIDFRETEIIVTVDLTIQETGDAVKISIYKPQFANEDEYTWYYRFVIEGLPEIVDWIGRAGSQLDAILIPVTGIDKYLKESGMKFCWFEEDPFPGMPIIRFPWDANHKKELHELLDARDERILRENEARYREKYEKSPFEGD